MVRIAVAALLTFALSAYAIPQEPGAANVGKGNGQQFITGKCLSNADCASTCCARLVSGKGGVCSAKAVANEAGKAGCGFRGSAVNNGQNGAAGQDDQNGAAGQDDQNGAVGQDDQPGQNCAPVDN